LKSIFFFFFLFNSAVFWAQTQITELGELPPEIKETSGLILYNNP